LNENRCKYNNLYWSRPQQPRGWIKTNNIRSIYSKLKLQLSLNIVQSVFVFAQRINVIFDTLHRYL